MTSREFSWRKSVCRCTIPPRCSIRPISLFASERRCSVWRTLCSSGGTRASRACISVSSCSRAQPRRPGSEPTAVNRISIESA